RNAPLARGHFFDTVFFGGGTPTLLSPDQIGDLLETAKGLYTVSRDAEITCEANPATADENGLRALRQTGVNRLSMGVQSFRNGELYGLSRAHTAEEAEAFFYCARDAGFTNVNMDLMYGIPGQTVDSFEKTLTKAFSLSPEHISVYGLILEEGTPFYAEKDRLSLPEEDEELKMYRLLTASMREKGYLHYEISNYARDGFLCRHNLHYWHGESYLGFGDAAYSCFNGKRYGNSRDFSHYLQNPTGIRGEEETVAGEDEREEYIMLRLRLSEGIGLDEYAARFGERIETVYADVMEKYTVLGMAKTECGRFFLTEEGMEVSNTVITDFFS
ncbi:MAG: radical SAM family heme chaperone HemW, partial [Clostridia bacterium]|nr:radical SAM family heme chaperone HemW [Clostridia bacterium]